ncbi:MULTISPECIES: hypothetical protein [unclassified Bradyrhizobium]|uniref:hypothetical protein n=1 Tax=unclassified Bradyrhizobium TaxID=2631580 RepID=UPI00041A07F5|nr:MULTISPECIES: hypothetical protein [unclassified Bradyrhizobium]QIG95098.1 hypothetical protein G6P99_23610 [Bradyrhizobium sp. 6(2017)]
MKLVSAFAGIAALGGVALSGAPAPATPIEVPAAGAVVPAGYVCNEWGRCWHRHYYGGGYYHPQYWGGYGYGGWHRPWGWHRHWRHGYHWRHWHRWHHRHHWHRW